MHIHYYSTHDSCINVCDQCVFFCRQLNMSIHEWWNIECRNIQYYETIFVWLMLFFNAINISFYWGIHHERFYNALLKYTFHTHIIRIRYNKIIFIHWPVYLSYVSQNMSDWFVWQSRCQVARNVYRVLVTQTILLIKFFHFSEKKFNTVD